MRDVLPKNQFTFVMRMFNKLVLSAARLFSWSLQLIVVPFRIVWGKQGCRLYLFRRIVATPLMALTLMFCSILTAQTFFPQLLANQWFVSFVSSFSEEVNLDDTKPGVVAANTKKNGESGWSAVASTAGAYPAMVSTSVSEEVFGDGPHYSESAEYVRCDVLVSGPDSRPFKDGHPIENPVGNTVAFSHEWVNLTAISEEWQVFKRGMEHEEKYCEQPSKLRYGGIVERDQIKFETEITNRNRNIPPNMSEYTLKKKKVHTQRWSFSNTIRLFTTFRTWHTGDLEAIPPELKNPGDNETSKFSTVLVFDICEVGWGKWETAKNKDYLICKPEIVYGEENLAEIREHIEFRSYQSDTRIYVIPHMVGEGQGIRDGHIMFTGSAVRKVGQFGVYHIKLMFMGDDRFKNETIQVLNSTLGRLGHKPGIKKANLLKRWTRNAPGTDYLRDNYHSPFECGGIWVGPGVSPNVHGSRKTLHTAVIQLEKNDSIGNEPPQQTNTESFSVDNQSALKSKVLERNSRFLGSLDLANDSLLNLMNQDLEVDFNALDPVQQLVKTKEFYVERMSNQVSRMQEKQNQWETYCQWVDSRQEWIDNYPFEPTYHRTLKFSKAFTEIERPRYNPRNRFRTESFDDYNKYLKKSTAVFNANLAELSANSERVYNHAQLKTFYSNYLGYTEEFEMMHDILKEFGYGDNTIIHINLFRALTRYNSEIHEDPNQMSPYNCTWAERQKRNLSLIKGHLLLRRAYLNGEPKPSLDEVEAIRTKLINEIPREGFVDIEERFGLNAVNNKYRKELKEGDPLLYR